MKKIIFGFVVVLTALGFFVWSYLARPHGEQRVVYKPARMVCGSGKSGVWKYCIYYAQQGTNGGVAYLLHGRNLDERTWNDDTYYTALIQEHWENTNKKPPVIVTVSFGPFWLLAPKNSGERSGLLESFKTEVIPEIESKLGMPKYRAVFGESMGGLNSLILGLSAMGQFQKVAALCPPVYKDSPFSSWPTLKKSVERTGAVPLTILGVLSIAKSYAGNDQEWGGLDPLRLADHAESNHAGEFYISAPLYDKYGTFEGAEDLVKKMQNRGIKTSWRPLYGGHCAVDAVSLAEFLL